MRKWLPLVILASAQFIMVLDSSVMNVSISQIVDDLDTTVTGVQLAITAYTLVMAAFMLVGAKLGDIWGRDRTFGIDEAAAGAKVTQSEQKFIQAKVYRYLDDPDSALAHYKQAALLESGNFYILREYGLYLEKLKQDAMATPVLRRAYAINSRDKDVNAALERLGTVTGPSLKDETWAGVTAA